MSRALVAWTAVATAVFAALFAPREHTEAWLALLAASALVLAAAAQRATPSLVLQGGIALRLAALLAPVSLSDDVYRYAWDGALLLRGLDPYALTPAEAASTIGASASDLALLNSPHYYTIYPPLAQLAFAAGVALWQGTFGVRLIFVLADVLAIQALMRLLDRMGRPRAQAALYAWHPLVYWEVAAGAHTEALLVPLFILALAAALDDRPLRAAGWLGLAGAAKITALLALPILAMHALRRSGWRGALAILTAPLALVATFVPFASDVLVPHLTSSMELFVGQFSFDAPIYYGMRHIMGYEEGITLSMDDALMPRLALASLLAIAVCTVLQNGVRERLVFGLLGMQLATLLLSRVIHPWYLLPSLALAAAVRQRATLLLGMLLPISYLAYARGREDPWLIALQFAPFVVVLIVEVALRGREDAPPLELAR